MLNFKKIELSDIPILKSYFSLYPSMQCDKTAGATVMWSEYFNNRFTVTNDTLVLSTTFNGMLSFTYPCGKNPDDTLDVLYNFCDEHGISMVLSSVSEVELDKLKLKYGNINYNEEPDWFDYIYDKNALLNLSGKKYSTQRNHINKFRKSYHNHSFELIDKSNVSELCEFTENFTFNSDKDGSAASELEMCINVLNNFEKYDMPGIILRVNGKIIGYSIGEIVGDTLFCHIEKADTSYSGAYQMLTNHFIRTFAADDNVRYINREEDCGDEGLKKSKLSYHPIEIFKKYTVTIKKGTIL